MEPAVVEGRHILILWAPGGTTRPYKARTSLGKNLADWAYFVRKGSNTVRAKGADERELLGLANDVPFDDRVNHRATLADLDLGLIRTFLRAIGSDLYKTSVRMDFEALCRQMQIVDGPPEAAFPRNVGLLFFNEEPHKFFPLAQIDVVYFPDGAGGDRFEEKIFRGPLDRMLRESLAFIQSRYLGERVIKHPDRAEAERFYNFPYEALEEALANAVYHRGYPNYKQVIPSFANELAVIPHDRKPGLIAWLRSLGKDQCSVRLDWHKRGQLTLSHRDANGHSATMQVPAEIHGNPPVTAFNARYLADALEIGGTLCLSDELSPGICRHPTGRFCVIMPMRVTIPAGSNSTETATPPLHEQAAA